MSMCLRGASLLIFQLFSLFYSGQFENYTGGKSRVDCVAIQLSGTAGTTETSQQTVILTCPIQPESEVVSVRWTYKNDAFIALAKPGEPGLVLDDTKYGVPSLYNLTIHDVEITDDGSYNCVVRYPSGQMKSDSVNLDVYVPFIFKLRPVVPEVLVHEKMLPKGSNVTLICNALLGRPKADIHWFKNGLPLDHSSQIFITTKDTSDTKLYNSSSQVFINNLQPMHKGNYSCQASNKNNVFKGDHYYIHV